MTRFIIIMALIIQSAVLYSDSAETAAGSETAGANPSSAIQASAGAPSVARGAMDGRQGAMADKSPEREGFAESPPAQLAAEKRSGEVGSALAERGANSGAEQDTNCTVITSRKLTFDQKKSTVAFEGKVVVTDPALKIESDRLTVLLSNDKKVELIKAEGSVIITRDTIQAVSQTASYAVPDGKITLSGKPRVIRQKDYLSAETIVLWRDSNRIICEPNAHLVIYSEQNMQGQLKND